MTAKRRRRARPRQSDSVAVLSRMSLKIASLVDMADELQVMSGSLYWMLRRAERAATPAAASGRKSVAKR